MVALGDSVFHERETIEQFISMRCDNLILYSRYLSDNELIELAQHMPELRLLDRYIEQLSNRCVYFNHTTTGHIATQYSIDQGHKVIGCIAGNTAYQNAHSRYHGYKKALSLNNLPLDNTLVFKGERYDSEQGYKGIHQLWQQRPDTTALYVCSEDMASGCLDAIRELNITVPDDLAIISYERGALSK